MNILSNGIKSKTARRIIKTAVPFILMPAILIAGAFAFGEKMYSWISLVLVILAQLLFCAGFEKRTVGTRRIVITAVMTALSVMGRLIFAAVPGFKPITAIVIITAIWISGETGFLVGSLSALLSNLFFGHGPWTPFQMFAWGMIGLLAGYLSKPLKSSRTLLAIYGAFAGVAYSLFLDLWTVLWYNGSLNWEQYFTATVTALPHTLSYAVSNVIFLLLLGKPFGEKLERVKIKYGV